jgi:glucose-6-phosphate 1-dehydrogenase
VLVLVGATGDLAQRKLLPGLFHLAAAGFIPGCRIIGVSLDDIDADAFRKIARKAVDDFSNRKFTEEAWASSRSRWTMSHSPRDPCPSRQRSIRPRSRSAVRAADSTT